VERRLKCNHSRIHGVSELWDTKSVNSSQNQMMEIATQRTKSVEGTKLEYSYSKSNVSDEIYRIARRSMTSMQRVIISTAHWGSRFPPTTRRSNPPWFPATECVFVLVGKFIIVADWMTFLCWNESNDKRAGTELQVRSPLKSCAGTTRQFPSKVVVCQRNPRRKYRRTNNHSLCFDRRCRTKIKLIGNDVFRNMPSTSRQELVSMVTGCSPPPRHTHPGGGGRGAVIVCLNIDSSMIICPYWCCLSTSLYQPDPASP
jgi:hypothetical protein